MLQIFLKNIFKFQALCRCHIARLFLADYGEVEKDGVTYVNSSVLRRDGRLNTPVLLNVQ